MTNKKTQFIDYYLKDYNKCHEISEIISNEDDEAYFKLLGKKKYKDNYYSSIFNCGGNKINGNMRNKNKWIELTEKNMIMPQIIYVKQKFIQNTQNILINLILYVYEYKYLKLFLPYIQSSVTTLEFKFHNEKHNYLTIKMFNSYNLNNFPNKIRIIKSNLFAVAKVKKFPIKTIYITNLNLNDTIQTKIINHALKLKTQKTIIKISAMENDSELFIVNNQSAKQYKVYIEEYKRPCVYDNDKFPEPIPDIFGMDIKYNRFYEL